MSIAFQNLQSGAALADHVVVAHAVIESERAFVAELPCVALAAKRWAVARLAISGQSLNAPHEHAFASCLLGPHAHVPLAALQSEHPGVPQAWVSLCHWDVAVDKARIIAAEMLQLSEQQTEQIRWQCADLFEQDGLELLEPHTVQAATWRVRAPWLAGLEVASWSRVAERAASVDAWLGELSSPGLKRLRRLQNEFQMCMYTHAHSDECARLGLLPINSFWLHGAGLVEAPPTDFSTRQARIRLDERLSQAALRGDAATWREQWLGLNAELMLGLRAGTLKSITLCSQQAACQLGPAPRGLGQVFQQFFGIKPANSLIAML